MFMCGQQNVKKKKRWKCSFGGPLHCTDRKSKMATITGHSINVGHNGKITTNFFL